MPFADRQTPLPGEVFLDHVGHFVADIEAARRAATVYGFTPTDIAIHANTAADGTRILSGTGNFCIMLGRGYLEVLFSASDAPLARELTDALQRYPGVHLFALSSADAESEHARLTPAGFETRPLARLRRPIGDTGPEAQEARFTVARVAASEMPEGRVQFVTHHTPDLVWPADALAQANGVIALLDCVIVVDTPDTAAERFARFTGRPAQITGKGTRIDLDRAAFWLMSPAQAQILTPAGMPPPPYVPCYGLGVASLAETERFLVARGLVHERSGQVLRVPLPRELGVGAWYCVEDPEQLPWRTVS
jgi:hypothetical protein